MDAGPQLRLGTGMSAGAMVHTSAVLVCLHGQCKQHANLCPLLRTKHHCPHPARQPQPMSQYTSEETGGQCPQHCHCCKYYWHGTSTLQTPQIAQ